MSEAMQPGWWLASDGKWYPPQLRKTVENRLETPEGSDSPVADDWWLASDGKWYPPALHPDEVSRYDATKVHLPHWETPSVGEAKLRRYVGFVPDPGPEPEIRPELREPLTRPALVGTGAEGSATGPGAPARSPGLEDDGDDLPATGEREKGLDVCGFLEHPAPLGAARRGDRERPRHRRRSRRWSR